MHNQPLFILYPAVGRAGPTSVRRYFPTGPTHNLADIPRFAYVASDIPSPEPQFNVLHELMKAAQPRLTRLEQFLGTAPIFTPQALCEMTGPADNPYIFPFVAAQLDEHRQFVYARGLKELPAHSDSFSSVHFVSGPCLFSASSLVAIAESGNKLQLANPRFQAEERIVDIIVDPILSFYEKEASIRLTRFIIDLAAKLPPSLPYTIAIDVPRVQYYCYLLDAFARQLISPDLLIRWFDDVDRRHVQVSEFMRAQLMDWADRNGLPAPEIQETPGLSVVRDEIYYAISSHKLPSLAELTNILTSQDSVWRLMCEITPPQSFRDLIHYSYVAEELRQSLYEQAGPAPLLIAVEDHYEYKIYEAAMKILRRIRKLHPDLDAKILAFYPLEQIFVANAQPSSLYLLHPGESFIDESGVVYSVSALLENIYGIKLPNYNEHASNLEPV